MAGDDFQVVFRGELTGDLPEDEVRQKLAALFRMPEEKIAGLFSGKPVVVKRNLDEATARKFEAAFHKAGAQCEIRSAGTADPTPAADDAGREEAAAAGESARPGAESAPASNAGEGRASMAAAGDPNNTLLDVAVPADLSALDVDTSEAPLAPPADTPEPEIDTGNLAVNEDDSGNLSEHSPPPPADIDTSGLSLEEPDR